MPALRNDEQHFVPGAIREPVGDACARLRIDRHDHLVRDRQRRLAFPAVVLREERADDFVVRHFGVLDRERADVRELSFPNVQQRELDEISLAMQPEHVAIDVVGYFKAPRGGYFAQGGNLFGTTAKLGTLDYQSLELYVDNQRALRIEPTGTAPNIFAGYVGNSAYPGIGGVTVAGGGV